MLRFALAAAATALLLSAGAARAEDTITSAPQCNAIVDAMAQSWENHKYGSKAESQKVGDVLAKLYDQCTANNFAEAEKTIAELKPMLPKQ